MSLILIYFLQIKTYSSRVLFSLPIIIIGIILNPCSATEDNIPVFGTFRWFNDVYEPSGIVQLSDGRFIVAEDSNSALSILGLHSDGTLSAKQIYHESKIDQRLGKLLDMEAAAISGKNFIYVVSSHAVTSKGKSPPGRERLIRFRIKGDHMVDPVIFTDLKTQLAKKFPQLQKATKIMDAKKGGLNIEGLTFDATKNHLLIGFRSPLAEAKALIVTLENPAGIFDQNENPRFKDQAILLDLEGGGIRALSYDPYLKGYLIISRAERAGGKKTKRPFKLWFWKGNPGDTPKPVEIRNLKSLKHAESLTPVQLNGKTGILIVSDDGDAKTGKPGRYVLLKHDQLAIAEDPPVSP